MCWIWAFGKRVCKYPFRIISRGRILCCGFGKYSCFGPTSRSRILSLKSLKRMSFPAAGASTSVDQVDGAVFSSSKRDRDFSTFRIPTRFVGEIHVVLSALVIISCIGTIVSESIKISSTKSQEVILIGNGFILFSLVTMLVGLMDVGLSFLLIKAANEVSLDKCLFWYRSTITCLIAFSLLTTAFGVLLKSVLVILGLLPSLIFKPFALWLVAAFIEDIYIAIRKALPATQLIVPLEMLDHDIFDTSSSRSETATALLRQTSTLSTVSGVSALSAPNTATTSIGSYDQSDGMKRKTTVFLLNKQVSRDHSMDPDALPRTSEVVTLTRINKLPE